MATRKITIKSTVRPAGKKNVRLTTSVSNGHSTRTTSKTIRVK